ncbi:MAG: hypothetical protein WA634_03540, partial [Silvibacterium sp.]
MISAGPNVLTFVVSVSAKVIVDVTIFPMLRMRGLAIEPAPIAQSAPMRDLRLELQDAVLVDD